jgi:succinoglycan biosynthesis transport protein ExoP
MVLATLAAAGVVYFYLHQLKPVYVSTSRILVEKPSLQSRSDAPLPLGSTSSNYLQTQASLITSREIVAAALNDPNVVALPTLKVGSRLQDLVRTLSADVGKRADLISVTASSEHPEEAAAIVNAVVRAYIRWHEANRQLSTADLLKDLNRQLDRRLSELKSKRQERMAFEQRNPGVVERARGGGGSTRLELLKQDLTAVELSRLQQDSYYEKLVLLQSEPNQFRQYVLSQQGAAGGTADGARSRLVEALDSARLQLEEISARGGVQRSQVTLLQNRQNELAQRIAQFDKEFMESHLALAKAGKEDTAAREQLLKKMYDAELEKVQSVSTQDSEYAFLTSECQTLENLYNSLLAQINNLDLNAQLEGLNIHVVEKAVPAATPSSSQLTRILGIGLVLGLMIGAGLAFLRDWRDQRVRSADEITALLGVPVLGAVPSIRRRGIVPRAQRMQLAPGSHESEAYRGIRTALFFGTPREHAVTILVTSPARQDGKTTLVSNLGIAMAQAGQRTLVLDADLRKPTQHRVFLLNGHNHGLTDVLAAGMTLEETICRTAVPGLDVLAGGACVANPSELLSSDTFARVLEELKGRYDRILIDSPPIGTVTDAQILAAQCGLTLLVLRAEKSSRTGTHQARDALLTVGARLVGVVVNGVSRRDRRYSHYNYHYYGDGPSNGHERKTPALAADTDTQPENGVKPENEGR